MGLCYRRFIPGFSQVAAPLFALLKKQEAWVWNGKCQEAFETLRQTLCTTPVLQSWLDLTDYFTKWPEVFAMKDRKATTTKEETLRARS